MSRRLTNIQRLGLLLTGILMLLAGLAMWKCQSAGVVECESGEVAECQSGEVAECQSEEVAECQSVGVTGSERKRDFLNEIISDDI